MKVVSPAPSTAPNLSHALGGIWRLTYRRYLVPGHLLMLVIGLVALSLLLFATGPRGGGGEPFFHWVIDFYVTFLVPALAFLAGAGAMRDEMKSGTVDYVLTRPVPRPAFVVFKFASHLICTQIDFLIAFGVVLGFAVARHVPDLATIAPKLLIAQMLLIAAFDALGFLCGTITARYVVLGLAYGGIIEVGVGRIPTPISELSMTHQVRELLRPIWDGGMGLTATPRWLATPAILFAFCAVALLAAAAIFTLRELSRATES